MPNSIFLMVLGTPSATCCFTGSPPAEAGSILSDAPGADCWSFLFLGSGWYSGAAAEALEALIEPLRCGRISEAVATLVGAVG